MSGLPHLASRPDTGCLPHNTCHKPFRALQPLLYGCCLPLGPAWALVGPPFLSSLPSHPEGDHARKGGGGEWTLLSGLKGDSEDFSVQREGGWALGRGDGDFWTELCPEGLDQLCPTEYLIRNVLAGTLRERPSCASSAYSPRCWLPPQE